MSAITRVTKMLALMPVVALAAACNGAAPTAPTASTSTGLSTDLSATATGDGSATATALRGRPCDVNAIQLDVVESTPKAVWVEATYHYKGPVSAPTCPAPSWSSDRRGLMVDQANPFRAGFSRAIGGVAGLTAVSPNGISAVIKVQLGGVTDAITDPPEPPASCKSVVGVEILKQGPSQTGRPRIGLLARYQYSTPDAAPTCSVGPSWDSTRKGLTVDTKDGFQASIPALAVGSTVVTVTAPSGAKGEIVF